jgi:hypothetical protein
MASPSIFGSGLIAGLCLFQSTGFPVNVGISNGFMVGGFCSSAAAWWDKNRMIASRAAVIFVIFAMFKAIFFERLLFSLLLAVYTSKAWMPRSVQG